MKRGRGLMLMQKVNPEAPGMTREQPALEGSSTSVDGADLAGGGVGVAPPQKARMNSSSSSSSRGAAAQARSSSSISRPAVSSGVTSHYVCSNCSTALFAASARVDLKDGQPSFYSCYKGRLFVDGATTANGRCVTCCAKCEWTIGLLSVDDSRTTTGESHKVDPLAICRVDGSAPDGAVAGALLRLEAHTVMRAAAAASGDGLDATRRWLFEQLGHASSPVEAH